MLLKSCKMKRNPTKIPPKDFYYITRSMNVIYFIFGILPVWRNDKGRIQFKLSNWKMMYSILVYSGFIYFFTNCVVPERLHEVMKSLKDFDKIIYNVMFLSFGKAQYFYPIGGWISAKTFSNYCNTWINFEVKYKKTFGHPLKIDVLENKCFWLVVWSMFAVICLIFGQLLTLPTYNIIESFGFVYSSTVSFLYLASMNFHCAAIEMVADDLANKLNLSFNMEVLTQDTIFSHKKLWLYLNNINNKFSSAFEIFSGIILLSSFIDLVISSYGYLTFVLKRIQSNSSNVILPADEFGLIIAIVISAFTIVYPCNVAYKAVQKVETTFMDILSMASTKPYHPYVIKEILAFLDEIKGNPSVISLGGYVNLDRKLITKVFCTIVTYLVILIQFKIGFDQINANINM